MDATKKEKHEERYNGHCRRFSNFITQDRINIRGIAKLNMIHISLHQLSSFIHTYSKSKVRDPTRQEKRS